MKRGSEEIRELEYHFAVHSEPSSEWDLVSLAHRPTTGKEQTFPEELC